MKRNLRKYFGKIGAVERVAYRETYAGVDLYLVLFEKGRAVMHFARDGDGHVAQTRIQPLAP